MICLIEKKSLRKSYLSKIAYKLTYFFIFNNDLNLINRSMIEITK